MKSKYYVVYYRDFANTYYLVSATADTEHLLPKDAERITRKEAIRMCRAELERQKYDRAFLWICQHRGMAYRGILIS